jgi:anaerobic ribonucleoside-triphosphate reductase activating protein
MKFKTAGTVPESVVDGPGIRTAVFFQGCPHGCKGCHNPGTHGFGGGFVADTDDVLREAAKNPLVQGLTITGGEPFCQPDAVLALARGAKDMSLDVWCYTGYRHEDLLPFPAAARALEFVDVLVDGEFVLEEKTHDLPFRGSRNQRIINPNEKRKEQR